MLMLQALLADRFKLQLERQTEIGTVYFLTAPIPTAFRTHRIPMERPRIALSYGDTNGLRGYSLDGHNAPIALLAKEVSRQVHARLSTRQA